jgi:hypothetical protein
MEIVSVFWSCKCYILKYAFGCEDYVPYPYRAAFIRAYSNDFSHGEEKQELWCSIRIIPPSRSLFLTLQSCTGDPLYC